MANTECEPQVPEQWDRCLFSLGKSTQQRALHAITDSHRCSSEACGGTQPLSRSEDRRFWRRSQRSSQAFRVSPPVFAYVPLPAPARAGHAICFLGRSSLLPLPQPRRQPLVNRQPFPWLPKVGGCSDSGCMGYTICLFIFSLFSCPSDKFV